MLVCDQEECYPKDRTERVLDLFKDISLDVDMKHIYNSVEVGWNPESNDKINGSFEVLAKNNFQIQADNVEDKRLSLIHPYIGSPYSIENYIKETLKEPTTDNKADNRITVLACDDINIERELQSVVALTQAITQTPYTSFLPSLYFPFTSGSLIRHTDFRRYNGSEFYFTSIVTATKKVIVTIQGTLTASATWETDNYLTQYLNASIFVGGLGDSSFPIGFSMVVNNKTATFTCELNSSFVLEQGQSFALYMTVIAPTPLQSVTVDSSIISLFADTAVDSANYKLYRNQVITKGRFDHRTMYNLPMSPKRILLKHMPYISVSTWRNVHDIEFTSAERDADVITRMGYETQNITENAHEAPTTPVFLPMTISLKSAIDFDSLMEIIGENSYTPFGFNDTNFGNVQGWINNIAIKAGKEEEQEFELQAHII
jgi:hypothetical protein